MLRGYRTILLAAAAAVLPFAANAQEASVTLGVAAAVGDGSVDLGCSLTAVQELDFGDNLPTTIESGQFEETPGSLSVSCDTGADLEIAMEGGPTSILEDPNPNEAEDNDLAFTLFQPTEAGTDGERNELAPWGEQVQTDTFPITLEDGVAQTVLVFGQINATEDVTPETIYAGQVNVLLVNPA